MRRLQHKQKKHFFLELLVGADEQTYDLIIGILSKNMDTYITILTISHLNGFTVYSPSSRALHCNLILRFI